MICDLRALLGVLIRLSITVCSSPPTAFFTVQATERMKIVDVLGAKQFSDGERIITQVGTVLLNGERRRCHVEDLTANCVFLLLRVTKRTVSILWRAGRSRS